MTSVFRWGALSERQRLALCWWLPGAPSAHYNGIIADGAIRSGKTVSLGFGFCVWAMANFDGQVFALCGKTIASLRRNLLGTLKAQMAGRGYEVRERRGDNLLLVRDGARENSFYLFGGKDEGSQALIQGITLAGVLFDEVALMPESFVSQATARCSVAGSKFWFNCNPEGPYHWFYRDWVLRCRQRRLLYLHFTMEDNLTLAPEIKARYAAQYTGVFYQRYILGRWVKAEGLVYPFMAEPGPYLWRGDAARLQGRFFVSVDYGTYNPCSMGLWCVQEGRAIRVKESYHDGRAMHAQRTDEEHYAALEALCRGFYVQQVVVDPSAASFIETIRRHGRFQVLGADNDVLNGIRVTAGLLRARRVLIGAGCADSLREFSSYCWDEEAGADKVIKENDHAMDDIRYFCMTVLAKALRWADWRDLREERTA